MSYLIAMLVRAVLSLIVILGRVVLNKFMAVRMTRYRWSNVSKKLLVSSRKMFRNQIQLKKKKKPLHRWKPRNCIQFCLILLKLVQRKRRLLHIRKQRQFYTPLLNPESNAPPKVRALSKMLLHQLY